MDGLDLNFLRRAGFIILLAAVVVAVGNMIISYFTDRR
jgi:hypothetical protein